MCLSLIYWKKCWWENSRINCFYQLNFRGGGPLPPIITTSRRCKCVIQKWVLPLDFVHRRLDLFVWYSLRGPRRTTESLMTKFGFIRCGKGEIFWRKTERNETTAQLSDLERQRLQVSRLFALTSHWTPKGDWKHFMPSSFFAQCFQAWFVFIKTEHFHSFKKRP